MRRSFVVAKMQNLVNNQYRHLPIISELRVYLEQKVYA